MTNLSPEDMKEEEPQERSFREKTTGVFGNGHFVNCHPTGDPSVSEPKHRVVCLTKPFAACSGCRHSKFKLVFNADAQAPFQTVMCPRWNNEEERLKGSDPENYVETEIKTCSERPYPFCPSCPSFENLSKMFIDKKKDSWYSRYKRFEREEDVDV